MRLEDALRRLLTERSSVEDLAEHTCAAPPWPCMGGPNPLKASEAHESPHQRQLDRVRDDRPRRHRTEIDERPEGVRDRDAVAGRAPLVIEVTRPVHQNAPWTRQPSAGDGDLAAHLSIPDKPPESCCAAVRSDRTTSSGEHGSEQLLLP